MSALGPSRRLLLLLALAGPGVLLLLAFFLRSRGGQGFDDLTREWSAAWAMIREHFWLGVGPGNYSRHYPKYMAPSAPAFASQPDTFILEVWATLGLPALLALAVALVNFFRRTLTFTETVPAELDDDRTRWEFYEGGMVGLLVGFVIRVLPTSTPETITAEALAAGVRAVVWFAAFALLQGIRWGGATRVLACTAGVAVLLLHLAVAGGVSVPGVTQPLWIMAALALNGLPERPRTVGRQFLGRVLPLALATAVALLCLLQVFQPLTSGATRDSSALASAQKYLDLRSGVSVSQPDGKTERISDVGASLKYIVTGLADAAKEDPANARYKVDAANWFGELFETFPTNLKYYNEALGYARDAQRIDPLGEGGYLAEARAREIAARRSRDPDVRSQAAGELPVAFVGALKARPNDAPLHYHYAVACFGAGEPLRGKLYAELALELDRLAPTDRRRLTDPQRRQAQRFVSDLPPRRPLP